MFFPITFNKDVDYIKTVDRTKTLFSELIKYFDSLAKEVDTKKLSEMMTQIDNPFMMLICGEYNSGKSTFINALLGSEICKVGATPTTDKINIIKHGYSDIEELKDPIINTVDIDLEILKDFLIVDTPGTNSIIKKHQEITKEFIHRAELILFVTSVDRPFSESEREMLELISSKYGKKIVFILNKVDQKEKKEIDEIIKFIEESSLKLLEIRPIILTISSKFAYDGMKSNDKEKIKKGNLKNVINDINDIYKKNALYLKLDSPLSTSLKLLEEVKERIGLDSKNIEDEFNELEEFSERLNKYQQDLLKDYKKKITVIKGSFYEIENEIYRVIDSITFFKLLRSKLPFSKKKLKYNFENEVRALTKKVNISLENLTYNVAQDSKKSFEQGQSFIIKQISKYNRDDMYIQTASPDYMETGKNILNMLRQNFDMNYNNLNLPQESKNIKKSIDDGFSASLIGSIASLGIGGALIAVLPTAVLDITGISLSIVLAVTSLFILPMKKRQAKELLSKKFNELCENLLAVTIEKIEEDITKDYDKIERNIRPYKSFVSSERGVVKKNKDIAEKLKKEVIEIKTGVEKKFKSRKSKF